MAVVKVEGSEHWWASSVLTATGPGYWSQASFFFKKWGLEGERNQWQVDRKEMTSYRG